MSEFNHLKLSGVIAESGKTQKELSAAIGVHYNTVSAWATGKAEPTPAKLYSLLMAAGWSPIDVCVQRLGDWYLLNEATPA